MIRLAEEKAYKLGALTISETVELAEQLGLSFSEVVIAEAMYEEDLSREEVLAQVEGAFQHNLSAIEIGLTSGKSFLMGETARELAENDFAKKIVGDDFLNKALVYTVAAQIGNHSVGLEPCAGTGDSCPYTGLFRAMLECYPKEKALQAAAAMLKVGTIFREGKVSTGCNMEGFGAGAAATAAAFVELKDGSAAAVERAITLAVSPTIANPCTPRVMVAGLCATHICGALLMGNLAAGLAVHTGIPVLVPADVMIAMAAEIHTVSAKHVVPVVNRYMRAFFKTNAAVEAYISPEIKSKEKALAEETVQGAREKMRELAGKANPIVKPFGPAVVGGSSQAVGSPTNAARVAHYLARGTVTKVVVELYPELFARRGINLPGILMGACFGAHTGDGQMYHQVMDKVKAAGIEVEVKEVDEPQLQRITVMATERSSMVESLNRGGGRIAIRDAMPSKDEALKAAQELGIVVTD
ncbi:MAG TPA: serine dehydratase [Clostridia bacterium]|nr:serine dehydratase [Clostridia bacterium]